MSVFDGASRSIILFACFAAPIAVAQEYEIVREADIKDRCWTRTTVSPLRNFPTSTTTYCFKSNKMIDFLDFGGLHGASSEIPSWNMEADHLTIGDKSFDDTNRKVCHVSWLYKGQVLALGKCELDGEWYHDARMTRARSGER